MSIKSSSLRLSAIRAFFGRIHESMRLIKIRSDDDEILLTVICGSPPTKALREDVSIAETEILADFPDSSISTRLTCSNDAIPSEDVVLEGWIYLEKSSSKPTI